MDDGKTVLDLEDDAAHANLGDNWRMPTVAEWQELIDNCIWEWTILENGVKGMKVTSNNGNSIFLPAAGYIYCGSRYSGNYSGDYWTSSLSVNHENDFAAEMTFGPYSQQAPRIYDWSGRQIGRSIRPVYVE